MWKRRIEQCRRAPAYPAQAGVSISDIASRWGFLDMSHLSRASKRAVGAPPRRYR
ncbi:helix-turn-helix domain-containing protein [Thiohalorhabdus sp. Cl-TMA]|uniref:Helix-turn-helix domain-containing protein n=1 Tax=Thiohalorhabdus methylotrophus TaxID=3242694 RepID=A0ABV4TY68_9GAMM